jgi:hypothetical protein
VGSAWRPSRTAPRSPATPELHQTHNTGAPTVSVTVTNTGTRTSREVVQVYFKPAGRSTRSPGRLACGHRRTGRLRDRAHHPRCPHVAVLEPHHPHLEPTIRRRSTAHRPRPRRHPRHPHHPVIRGPT